MTQSPVDMKQLQVGTLSVCACVWGPSTQVRLILPAPLLSLRHSPPCPLPALQLPKRLARRLLDLQLLP
jgi:hypothetical protein